MAVGPGCAEEETRFPVAIAKASRHASLRDGLVESSRAFAFVEDGGRGEWTGDLGDAPAFGLAALGRRADLDPAEARRRAAAALRAKELVAEDPLAGPPDAAFERLMSALGLLAFGGADAEAAAPYLDRVDGLLRDAGDDVERFADRLPAIAVYGSTVPAALVAIAQVEASLVLGEPRAEERRTRAVRLERALVSRSFGDLVDPGSTRSSRAFARRPGELSLTLLPNAIMMLLDARLFRATRDETYLLRARALFAAAQPLLLPAPAAVTGGVRYAEPEAAERGLGATRDVSTLAGQSALALALLAVFEVTGDGRYVDEADRILDAIAGMRDGERLAHHVADGRLADDAGAEPASCAGCMFHALLATGVRRTLAGEPF